MNNDDTPETNEAQFGTGMVSVEFARRLERQRDHLRRELGKYRGQINNEGLETACAALDCPPVFAGEYLVLPNGASALLPCPFCGGPASHGTVRYSDATIREQNWGQDTFHFINCTICGAKNKGLVGHRTPEKAAEKWNRRWQGNAELRNPQPK